MSKSQKNIASVTAVLALGILVAGLGFIAKKVFNEPLATSPQTESTSASSQTNTAASDTATTDTTDTKNGAAIILFETSDIHGYLMDTTGGDASTFQYRLAYMAKVFNDARESGEYDDVLLIDGGDIYQGAPLSNLTDGAALRAAFDLMDYDAVSLGNHEFDWNVKEYATDSDCTLPAYSIGSYSGDPDIPVLASDLCYADTHARTEFTKDYVIVEKAGYKIALIGYIPDYSGDIMRAKISPYEIQDDLSSLSQRVKEINEAETPDITIVLAHQDPITVAAGLDPEDVDLIAGGHTHAGLYGTADNGIPYIQSDCNAKGYSQATLVISADGTVTIEDQLYTSITENSELLYDTPENAGNFDEEVLALSHVAWDSISDEMNEELGYIDASYGKNDYVGGVTTSGGNFITNLMLEYYSYEGAVAAFYNGGGVRAGVTVPEGETVSIRVSDIYAVNPFGNVWLLYDISGEELARQIEDGLKNPNLGEQVSGLTYEYNDIGTEEEPDYEIVSITLSDGTAVDIHGKDPVYRIVISNYSATLEGSVFEDKTPVYPVADAPIDSQALIELLRDRRDRGETHIPVDRTPRGKCLNKESGV